MELTIERTAVAAHGIGQVSKATIKATAKVFNFFSDQTYTDKARAIIRELTANAIDAHKMGGNPNPVEVYLPTAKDPVLRVRDQGIGMSHDFMLNQFMAYTDGTTKTDSNVAIGGFGIGSKSPFSYTDQYMIRSVHLGMCGVYSVFKDEDGIPAIMPLSLEAVNEPCGVEIQVPIQAKDFAQFQSAAEEHLAYFDPRPILYNGHIDGPHYTAEGPNWGIRQKSGPLGIIMGGIRYPVDVHGLPYDIRQDTLANYGIDLTLPIGAVGIAISREALSLDEKSISAIAEAMNATREAITSTFETLFEGFGSLWEARKQLAIEAGSNHARGRLVSQHAKYRGESFQTQFRVELEVWTATSRGRKTTMSKPDFVFGGHIQASSTKALVIDDLDPKDRKGYVSRLRERFDGALEWQNAIVVVRGGENETVEQILDKLGNPPRSDYILLSELPKPVIERMARTAAIPRSVQLYRCVSNHVEFSSLRELTIIPEGVTCKVVMTNYVAPAGFLPKWQAGIVDQNEVLFVNKKSAYAVEHIPDFEVIFEQKMAEIGDGNRQLLAQIKAVQEDSTLMPIFHQNMQLLRRCTTLTPSQQKTPFGRLCHLFHTFWDQRDAAQLKGMSLVEPKLPPRLNPQRLLEQLTQNQPGLKLILDNVPDRVLCEDRGLALVLENI